jgi:hypothetical protein
MSFTLQIVVTTATLVGLMSAWLCSRGFGGDS